MKHLKLNLLLAAGGSLVLCILALIDPGITWRQCLGVHIGIWAMGVGQSIAQILVEDQKQP
jgi:hypothetical protein